MSGTTDDDQDSTTQMGVGCEGWTRTPTPVTGSGSVMSSVRLWTTSGTPEGSGELVDEGPSRPVPRRSFQESLVSGRRVRPPMTPSRRSRHPGLERGSERSGTTREVSLEVSPTWGSLLVTL